MLFKRHSKRSPKTADASSPKPPRSLGKRMLHDWVFPLALVVAILTPLRQSIADWNDVPSGSMRPTILEGDRIYVNKLAFGLRVPFTTSWITHWDTPQRGEIVTFKSPADGIRLVKRVIGLPGDRIAMQGNQLIINGKMAGYSVVDKDVPTKLSDGRMVNVTYMEEQLERTSTETTDPQAMPDGRRVCQHGLTIIPIAMSPSTFRELIVPEGQYFMMGDNRDLSRDSRMIGFVPLESIYGRSSYVALSVDPENSYLPRFARWFTRMR